MNSHILSFAFLGFLFVQVVISAPADDESFDTADKDWDQEYENLDKYAEERWKQVENKFAAGVQKVKGEALNFDRELQRFNDIVSKIKNGTVVGSAANVDTGNAHGEFSVVDVITELPTQTGTRAEDNDRWFYEDLYDAFIALWFQLGTSSSK